MELEGEDVEEEILDEEMEKMLQEDNEKTQLPGEWIYDLELKNQSHLSVVAKAKSCSAVGQQEFLQQPPSDNQLLSEKGKEVEVDISWSQPTAEDKERHQPVTFLEKAKKATKKQDWGPVIPTRRSSRIMDNGKTVTENAQEFKRKWSLEDNTGKTKKSTKLHVVSKHLLLSVAKEVGIDVEDGNPILDRMVELDSSRLADMNARCSKTGCSSRSVDTEAGVNEGHNKNKISSNDNTLEQCVQDGSADQNLDDQEFGWSKVGPRKRNKKKFK